ncbi:MAG: hypothetical protein LUO98_02775 [Methanoregula sp.]|nr:hypothetical protein [Methanoregula sp.]
MLKTKTILLILVVIACIFSAGCTQSSGNGPVTPAVPATPVPTPEPATPVPTAAATSAPQEVVTIVRYVSCLKDVKDSYLLFTLQVPVEWNVSTYRLTNSDTSDYRTDLVAGNVFSVYTYYFSQDRERAYRDLVRQWSPAPTETTVTINDITYDRFESASDGKTRVSYIVRKNSANERGYANMLVFTARDSNRFEKEDFEKVVSSFRYYAKDDISSMPGEEIPLFDLSGNALSHKGGSGGSLAWGQWEGDSAGDDSSGETSSGGDSSGGDSSDDSTSSGGGGCTGGG